MLILPLHKPLNADTFPRFTALLIVVNVLVFALLQSGDDAAQERALHHYQQQQLHQLEFPAYRNWLSAQRRAELDDTLSASEPLRHRQLFHALQSDRQFLAALASGEVIGADTPGYARWKRDRAEFDRQWAAVFTEHWYMRYDEFNPLRMVTAMFLHADAGHLLGNMLFLGFLGLLVEGALGPVLFIALYLLGGIGGQLFSLYWRWGEPGGLLGASGAIAALMGAYCVLWGMRKVRFFYWFAVIFDYVKAPALWLLLPWLGWELSSLLLHPDAGIGFDAHAGGMIAGALLAAVVRQRGWQRDPFIEAETRADAEQTLREDAAAAMGELQFARAYALYEQLLQAQPQDLDLHVARYRAAKFLPASMQLDRCAESALRLAVGGSQLRAQLDLWQDYLQASKQQPKLSGEVSGAFLMRLIEANQLPAADTALAQMRDSAAAPEGLAQLALALAQRLPPGDRCRRDWLAWLQQQRLDPAAAAKARLIIDLDAG